MVKKFQKIKKKISKLIIIILRIFFEIPTESGEGI